MRYDIVCEFVLCTFNLRDSQQRECAKKNNFGEHWFIFVYFMIKTKTC